MKRVKHILKNGDKKLIYKIVALSSIQFRIRTHLERINIAFEHNDKEHKELYVNEFSNYMKELFYIGLLTQTQFNRYRNYTNKKYFNS